jgi:hypothetical protein
LAHFSGKARNGGEEFIHFILPVRPAKLENDMSSILLHAVGRSRYCPAAEDRGQLLDPTLASYAGRAVIMSGTGELSGLRGVLEIEGTIDLVSGLATYSLLAERSVCTMI